MSAVYDPKSDISARTVRATISAKSLAKNGATVQDVIEQARRDDQGTDAPVVTPQAKAAQTRKARKAKSAAINADAATGTQSSAVRDTAMNRKASVKDEIPNGTVQAATFDSSCPVCSSPMLKGTSITKVAGRFQHTECPATASLATVLKGQSLTFSAINSMSASQLVEALASDLPGLTTMLEATLELGMQSLQSLTDALTLQRNTSAKAVKAPRKAQAA
jgi:hypothetical protein